jgi:hypothetical protein
MRRLQKRLVRLAADKDAGIHKSRIGSSPKFALVAFASIASTVVLIAGFLAVLLFPTEALATSVRLNTGNEGKPGVVRGAVDPGVTWNYTGDFNTSRFNSYVDNDPFFPGATTVGTCHMLGGNCRLGSNTNYGPDVTAGHPAYLGVQFFYLSFDLPANAINVSLEVTNIGADDRVGMHLNGNEIGFWGNHSGAAQNGRIDGSDVYAGTSLGAGVQPSLNPVSLQSPFGFPDFTLNNISLFLLGDTNVIRLWVNNTNSRNPFAAARPMSSGDPSLVGFDSVLGSGLITSSTL